jgi:hypothetical protein
MAWLAAIVVLLLLVFSSGFRKLAAIAAALIAAVVAIFISVHEQSQREARALIPPSEVELQDIKLHSDGGSYKLLGRIRNNSPSYTLTGLSLKIILHDCDSVVQPSSPNCVTIGQSEEHPLFESIPPGQVRELDDYIFPGTTKPRGKLVWEYSVAYTEGK